MARHHELNPFFFKGLLFLFAGVFAVAAALLLFWFTSAATVTGAAPSSAVTLVEGVNSGVLGPGEQRWFRFKPDGAGRPVELEKTLTLVFTRYNNPHPNPVTFQLFEENQIPFFYQGDASRMTNLGAGQVMAARDNNPGRGELLWTGWLPGSKNYYIHVVNGSLAVVDYWLLNGVAAAPEPAPLAAPVVVAAAPGTTPPAALPLAQAENRGALEPGQESWYTFSLSDSDGKKFEPANLTMVTTPDNGQRLPAVTFEVFTAGAVKNWSPGGAAINNLGAGSIVTRDNNPWTGERFWSGWVLEEELYYIRVRNTAEVRMDYWLFVGDLYNSELGQNAVQ